MHHDHTVPGGQAQQLSFAQQRAAREAIKGLAPTDLSAPGTRPAVTRQAKSPVRDEAQPAVAVSFTLASSVGLMTKTAAVGPAGNIVKSGSIKFYSGTAIRVSTKGQPIEILTRLKDVLESLSSKQAIICAPPPADRDEWTIAAKDSLPSVEDAIARTKDNFRPVEGPALLGLDFDTAEFPPDLLDCIRQAGSISAALAWVYPLFDGAAALIRPSASSAIKVKGAARPELSPGQHRYFIVSDGSQIAEAVTVLADRLMLAGFIWGRITQTGAVLPRTLFDLDASRDSSRLWFEAHPVLTDDRLELDKGARVITVTGTRALDLSGLIPLSKTERRELEAIKAELIGRLEPQANAAREAYEQKRIREMVAKGTSEEAARRQITRALDKRELVGDFEILFDDNSSATVREIRADPAAFHSKTGPDPLETDYNGGRNIAKIYSDGQQPFIHSLAHGGIKYLLLADKDDFFEEVGGDIRPDREKPNGEGDGEPSSRDTLPKPSRFKFETLADIDLALAEDPIEPLIDGLLDQGAFSCVYGGSNVGKTFVVLDMAYAIAQGRAWAGQRTMKKGVLYVAAEGGRGVLPRVMALAKIHGGVGAKNFVLLRNRINLFTSDADVKELLLEARAQGLESIGLVVFDTLSRSMDGGDENGVKDMSRVIAHIDLLRRQTDAHVMLVHHSGKNEAKGLRGSSALRAALDTEIELQKTSEDGSTGGTFIVGKQRDMDGNFTRNFSLDPVKLIAGGGREISACIARMSTATASRQQKLPKAQQKLVDAMRELGAEATPVEIKDIADHLHPGIADARNRAKAMEAVRSCLRRCEERKIVRTNGDGLWLLWTSCPRKEPSKWFVDEENPVEIGSTEVDEDEELENA